MRTVPWYLVRAAVIIPLLGAPSGANLVTRQSVSTDGIPGNADSRSGTVSDDGRWVAFQSDARDLVTGDTNGATDVFLRDRQLGTTTRVSVGPGGVQGNDNSLVPKVSADGTVVVFTSAASNLVANDTNHALDVFVRDVIAGTTARVSVGPSGVEADGNSIGTGISADGRYVVFVSIATNLVPGDTNGKLDVFVHDRQTGTTSRMSLDGASAQVNGFHSSFGGMSRTGRFVLFTTQAALVPEDTNGFDDVYLRDTVAGTTVRVSVDTGNVQRQASSFGIGVSDDGTLVAFDSTLPLSIDEGAFVRDLAGDVTKRVDGGNVAGIVALTPDGHFVLFSTRAQLVPQDQNNVDDVYLRDLQTDQVSLFNVDDLGRRLDAFVETVSPDLRFATLLSSAPSLVPADLNDATDVFVLDRATAGAVCGDHVVTAPETCDDGNLTDGDGCEHDCSRTVCASGAALSRVKLLLSNLDLSPNVRSGKQRVSLSFRLPLGAGPLDPAATGVQIRVEDGSGDTLADWTARVVPIGPGSVGSTCGNDGWRVAGAGRAFLYTNATGALDPPLCIGSTANGLQKVRVTGLRATTGAVDVLVQAKNATIPPSTEFPFHQPPLMGPARVTAVLTATPGGPCGVSATLACVPNHKGTALRCQ